MHDAKVEVVISDGVLQLYFIKYNLSGITELLLILRGSNIRITYPNHLYIFTQPSFGQENRIVASSLSPSPFISSSNVPSGPGFLEVSWETQKKSPGETLQSNRQACKKLGTKKRVQVVVFVYHLGKPIALKQIWVLSSIYPPL